MSDMIDFEKKIKKPLFIFIVAVLVIMYFFAPAPAKAGVVTEQQSMFVNKAGEVILLTKSIGATETVTKMEGDMVVWLITSGYNSVAVLPSNAVKDVYCIVDIDAKNSNLNIACHGVSASAHRKDYTSGGRVNSNGTSLAFTLYNKYPEIFYGWLQQNIMNMRSGIRGNERLKEIKE
jgi:hypothetical protein